ncbi:sigma-54-dependent transcriptional regulator [Caldimonas thermodepolymerans]|uniref:Two-component system response regulator PilR (NtrC family) n=1 Tax=Caldimonas thermodepolymerans TaxID=215580 RepID=A0AA46DGX4_9BURK|nr:sigma-54 dependent transcriptional regulator [Caldimonas thermodepolymerans]TCP09060.1 two-component system response regulator PilR (NtrC family) [Caldimonas thermodepolymerans]UZG47356.1 sigma-54 dependent transcriptional regulator [Caldimonas thermodepolymerans]
MTSASHYSLLVVDDEPDLRTLYELTLLREGYDVETAATVEDAWARLKDRTYSAVITDMRLPDGTGLDLLRRLEEAGRREKTIMITAFGSPENAVEALKAGAYDYLTKPVDLKQFRTVVASALGRPSAVPASGAAASSAVPAAPHTRGSVRVTAPAVLVTGASGAMERMAGMSPAMQQVRSLIEKVARSMAPVLVQGESGTGKELVARAIHEVSARRGQPFIAVNCGAIPEQLLEAEFFGYRKGAFTGANEDREGFFQAARGGTLFLDEIGDLPLSMQSKLLRVIQERAVRPVGAVAETPIDVRIVSATHKDLAAEVQAGRFRQDLYYRLNVIQIRVPALRERLEDLPLICERVLERIAQDAEVWPPPRLTPAALAHLARYPFPGNIRELENLLHRAVALSGGEWIDQPDLELPDAVLNETALQEADAPLVTGGVELPAARGAGAVPPASQAPLPSDLAAYLDEVERDILIRALERHRYNRTAAGASLGLSLRQMRYRMARLGVMVAEHGVAVESDDH